MAAYVISEVEFLDQERVKRYRELAAETIARYGGRYLARGGAVEVVEGEPTSRAIIIVEFPDMPTASKWYGSPEYAVALEIRRGALERRLMFVEGV